MNTDINKGYVKLSFLAVYNQRNKQMPQNQKEPKQATIQHQQFFLDIR